MLIRMVIVITAGDNGEILVSPVINAIPTAVTSRISITTY